MFKIKQLRKACSFAWYGNEMTSSKHPSVTPVCGNYQTIVMALMVLPHDRPNQPFPDTSKRPVRAL